MKCFCFLLGFLDLVLSDLSYGYQNLEYETWILTDQWSSAKQSLAVIDTQIEQDLYDLPLRITAAAEAILGSVSDTNHDYGSIVGLLVLGRIIRIFGGTQGATLDLNTILGSVVGPVFITTSYAASRVNRLRRPDQVVDCDLGQYANILQQYEVLLSLRETYSILDSEQDLPTYNNPGTTRHASEVLTPGLQPHVLKHTVRDFIAELKKSLACVLDKKTGASKELDRCLDLLGKAMERRLDLTGEYIDILNRIEVNNEKYNQV